MNLTIRKTRLVLATVAALGVSTLAQADNLLSIYREAQRNDATFAAARYGLEAGREKITQARSQLLPQVGLGGKLNRIYGDYDPGNPDPTLGVKKFDYSGSSGNLNIQASQALYRPQYSVAVDQAGASVSLSELEYRGAEQQLILRVAQAYMDVLEARDKVTLSAAQKEAFAEQLAQAKKRFQVGVATITDTYEAQSRYDQTAALEIVARNDLLVKTNALSQLIGKQPGWLSSLDQKMKPQLPVPASVDAWLQKAAKDNVRLQSQLLLEQIAKYEVQRNKDGHKPTLDLVGSYGNTWDIAGIAKNGGTDQTRIGAIGVQLNVPLYTGGGLSSKDREAAANFEKSKMQTEATRREVEQNTKSAYLGMTNGAATIAALEQALISTQSQLDATKTGQQVGVRTNVDVLNAQQQYYEARFNLQKARYVYLMASLNLAAASGDLTEAHLEGINKQLVEKP
ncbi:MAG: channel protein TolC [Neisseriaceae bacterium]|jgi:outer membrane protein|nr:MAG: channel protein TolC [Neisseriaceae bacterium]